MTSVGKPRKACTFGINISEEDYKVFGETPLETSEDTDDLGFENLVKFLKKKLRRSDLP